MLLDGLAELGAHAEQAGVVLLLEPLNRYEDHMVNTVAQAAELIAEAGSAGVRILADTYHMNIEEDDPCAALRSVAGVLGAVHLSDSNRHQPGTGPRRRSRRSSPRCATSGSTACCRSSAGCAASPPRPIAACGRYLRGVLDAA